jgi:hypothetical protein
MALSGTIWGSFSAKSTSIARPYITWSADQSISGNTSTVTAKLYFVRYDGYRSWDLNGQNFTVSIAGDGTTQNQPYDIGPNGQNDLIMTISKTVSHNDDGRKSINISASGNTNNSALGTISLSATITLDTIPRASDFTAFTLSNPTLNTSTATTINYTVDKKSSSFSHDYTLKYGSSTIKTWTGSGSGSLSTTLTASEVNSIINLMSNTTSGTLKMTMQTKSGSSKIGSSKTINEGISLNGGIKPNASGLSVAISGSGRDKTINKYVQSISKVTASFNRSAGYGASISTSNITVKRQSDGANSQTISDNSGTTSNPVGLSGTYIVTGYVKDSRGRTDTVSTTITVHAYSSPKVVSFNTSRRTSPSTTVDAVINVSWSPLGTSNPTDIVIKGVDNNGVSTTHYTLNDSTAGSFNTTQAYTGQSDASSYTYTITVTDSFGNEAPAIATVGTSFVELTISKGKGIGVGKVHEEGALDLGGLLVVNDGGESIKINAGEHGYMSYYINGTRIGWVGNGSADHNNIQLHADVGDVQLSTSNGKVKLEQYVLDGKNTSNSWQTFVPVVQFDGVMEIGQYLDFHTVNSTSDFDIRLDLYNGDLRLRGGDFVATNDIMWVNGKARAGGYTGTDTWVFFGNDDNDNWIRVYDNGNLEYFANSKTAKIYNGVNLINSWRYGSDNHNDGARNGEFEMAIVPSATSSTSGYYTGYVSGGVLYKLRAGAADSTSIEELKTDIELLPFSPLEKIKQTDVYQWRWKDGDDTETLQYGLVIGDTRNVPEEVLAPGQSSIDHYRSIMMAWGATKELSRDMDWAYLEIDQLQQKVVVLEDRLSQLEQGGETNGSV